VLIRNKAGFYKWWVNVDYADERREITKAGYLIDAYRGGEWKEVEPFPKSAKPVDTSATIRQRGPETEEP